VLVRIDDAKFDVDADADEEDPTPIPTPELVLAKGVVAN
jgi:hypothetical protein